MKKWLCEWVKNLKHWKFDGNSFVLGLITLGIISSLLRGCASSSSDAPHLSTEKLRMETEVNEDHTVKYYTISIPIVVPNGFPLAKVPSDFDIDVKFIANMVTFKQVERMLYTGKLANNVDMDMEVTLTPKKNQ
ncbi:MAG: hypothetical protein LBU14_02215 [Candidatus Peribacteria bacterium]|jgi:hypothetical protein|nr:hypothetical protein [Candidatus Peribacteria bacterium]